MNAARQRRNQRRAAFKAAETRMRQRRREFFDAASRSGIAATCKVARRSEFAQPASILLHRSPDERRWSLFGAAREVLNPYYNQDVSGADDKDLECGDLSPLLRFADSSAKQSRVQRRGDDTPQAAPPLFYLWPRQARRPVLLWLRLRRTSIRVQPWSKGSSCDLLPFRCGGWYCATWLLLISGFRRPFWKGSRRWATSNPHPSSFEPFR